MRIKTKIIIGIRNKMLEVKIHAIKQLIIENKVINTGFS